TAVKPATNPVEISFAYTLVTVEPGKFVTVGAELQGINLPRAGTDRYLRHVYYPMEMPGLYRLRWPLGAATSNQIEVNIRGKADDPGVAESKPVRVQDVDFQAVIAARCPVPSPGAKKYVQLGLRLTNRGDKALAFNLFDTLKLRLKTAEGKP